MNWTHGEGQINTLRWSDIWGRWKHEKASQTDTWRRPDRHPRKGREISEEGQKITQENEVQTHKQRQVWNANQTTNEYQSTTRRYPNRHLRQAGQTPDKHQASKEW